MKRMGQKPLKILFTGAKSLPHLQKHDCKIPCRITNQPNARIFPMSVGMGAVNVFIRKVDAAVESGMAVDAQNFAVVTMVHHQA